MKRSALATIVLRLPVLIGVGVAVVWIAASNGAAILSGLSRANPVAVAGMLAVTAFWLATRIVRWQFMMRRSGTRIPIRGSAAAYLAGLPGTATPGYVGELVRGVFIKRRYGVPFMVTTYNWVAERLMDLAALTLILALSTDRARVALLVVLAVACVLGATVARAKGRDATTGIRSLTSWIAVVLILSLAAWLAAGALVFLAGQAIGIAIPLADSVRIFAKATLGAAITLMPAGIGSAGSIMILELGDRRVSLTDAVAITSLVRAMGAGVVLAVGSAFMVRELRIGRKHVALGSTAHFDEIAHEYGDQFSDHIWDHLFDRKLALMEPETRIQPGSSLVLDLGCGLGRQAAEMARRGHRVVGVDASHGLLRFARSAGVPVAAANAVRLPFADGAFSVVYTIGVLHHLDSADMQRRVCDEVARVLKPGGRFLIHESNIRNPLFRLYVSYLFPLLRSIDEGTEIWIHPSVWRTVRGFRLIKMTYFTFVADFVPRVAMRPLLALERRLESSWVRPYSAHYLAVLESAPPNLTEDPGPLVTDDSRAKLVDHVGELSTRAE